MAYTVCKEEQRKNRKRGQAEKMKYEHITEGRFIDRPNRFIAHVEINGQVETVHVKNTGRHAVSSDQRAQCGALEAIRQSNA